MTGSKAIALILTLLCLLPATPALHAQVVELEAVQDNTLYEDITGSLSNGAGAHLFSGATAGLDLRRALVKFDVATQLPVGATIDSVELVLNMSKTISGSETISLHKVTSAWGEGTSDATGQEGAGAPSQADDATWIHSFYDTTFWASAGGDYEAAPSATQSVAGLGSYVWGSTAQMVADVEAWVSSPASNFGWIIIGNEADSSSAKRFDSRENATPANRPKLRIYYTKEFFSIAEVFEAVDSLEGQTISVVGEFTHPDFAALVNDYDVFIADTYGPTQSVIFLEGTMPDTNYWFGGLMIATGVLSSTPDDLAPFPEDSLMLTLTAASYTYIDSSSFLDEFAPPQGSVDGSNGDDGGVEVIERSAEDCDSCKFAILISGGISAGQNKPKYWKNIEALYQHKVNNEGYCPGNIKILYFKGNSENTALIPNAAVDSCTQANVQKAHKDIAKKIAACEDAGKDATVQKMVTNHGCKSGVLGWGETGINMLQNEVLTGDELRAMQQELIDSCCDYMYDEMLQCFGGQIVNAMKGIDDKSKTEIHVNSNSGADTFGDSPLTEVHPYLKCKIDSLATGRYTYEQCVQFAKDCYRKYLTDARDAARERAEWRRLVADQLGNGLTPAQRAALRAKADQDDATANYYDNLLNDPNDSWVRYQLKEYCDWKQVVAPKGGQLKFEFDGSGGCGNVTVYEQQADGRRVRVREWNWTTPGSFGYMAGGETRVLDVDSNSTGIFWVHFDDPQGTSDVTITSKPDREDAATPSNPVEFAGGSAGGRDGSSDEFGDGFPPSHSTSQTFSDGFDLSQIPRNLGPCGPTQQYSAQFDIPGPNQWWEDMEVVVYVRDVAQPGVLQVSCPQSSLGSGTMNITQPGEYTVPLGYIDQSGGFGQLIFQVPLTSTLCFEWDSWGLRTLNATFEAPPWVCGDADGNGAVSISDAVHIINFIFGGGPAPDPIEAGDADCSGSVSIGDAVYIINYIFGGGPAPCSACP